MRIHALYPCHGCACARVRAQEWCRANRAEVLAAQPPGRGARMREPPFMAQPGSGGVGGGASAPNATAALAAEVLRVAAGRLFAPQLPPPAPATAAGGGCHAGAAGSEGGRGHAGQAAGPAAGEQAEEQGAVPYVVVSHSVGCWVGYELLMHVRRLGECGPGWVGAWVDAWVGAWVGAGIPACVGVGAFAWAHGVWQEPATTSVLDAPPPPPLPPRPATPLA
jgi:hypothetical protein